MSTRRVWAKPSACPRSSQGLPESLRPDVLLLDVTMLGNEHLAALRAVRKRAPGVRVLLLTMHADEALLRQALGLGASGYVLKKAEWNC